MTKGRMALRFSVVVDGENRRSLGYAPPDFLWSSVALADFMRLSLRERRTRGFVQCCVAGNPGRDDKREGSASSRRRWPGSQVSKARPRAPFDCCRVTALHGNQKNHRRLALHN